MKIETAINLLLEINEKYEKCDKKTTSKTYFEVLHCALDQILSQYTKEQYNALPEHMRATLTGLECNILTYCSTEYINKVDKYRKEHGVFRVEKSNDKTKAITKCKQTIGYIVEAEEGLNI